MPWLPDSGKFILVDGAQVPAPDDYSWGLQDVSAPGAGRTQDAGAHMHKMRVAQKRVIQLSWKNRDRATVAAIVRAFNPEYVAVTYLDALDDDFVTRTFYVGDRSNAYRSVLVGGRAVSTLSFNIIER